MSMPGHAGREVSLEDKLALLRRSETWPERPERIEERETHMSWVFLTKEHAYKLKKPVRYDFLDFSTLALRKYDCEEELRLNRTLAADVYLGVVPLAVDDSGRARVEGDGVAIEWLVKMRRLPADDMLDERIRRKELRPEQMRDLARVLARFYQSCPDAGLGPEQYRASFAEAIEINQRELAAVDHELPHDTVRNLHAAQVDFLHREAALFDARVIAGHVVEGHGDLRPEHICLNEQPAIIDCLEFNRRFRLVDPADELSFLAMECERLGAASVGDELLEGYTKTSGDRPPQRLLKFYRVYRACLRARLSIWHTRELEPTQWSKWQARAREYLRLAQESVAEMEP
jgi:aminoglycoside phosphotransferase family enzyme